MNNEVITNKGPKGINWHTAIFMGVSSWSGGRALCLQLAGAGGCDSALVDFRQPGRRHGFSQTLDSSWLQDAKDRWNTF